MAREAQLHRNAELKKRKVRMAREEATLRKAMYTYTTDMQELKRAVSAALDESISVTASPL